MALAQYKIALTGFSKSEKDINYQLIEELGGQAIRPLNSLVTHLIAKKSSPTDKYNIAIQRKIPILHCDFLHKVKELGGYAFDKLLELETSYKLQIFTGSTITVTGIDTGIYKLI